MEEIIKFLGGSALLLAAIAWIIRSLIQHFLSKDIEVFKNNLKAEAEKDLVKLTSSLQLENERLRIKLSALESRRLEVLEELFRLLVELTKYAEMFSWSPVLDDVEELLEDADKYNETHTKFYDFFNSHTIFLPTKLEGKIRNMHNSYSSAWVAVESAEKSELPKVIKKLESEMPNIRKATNEIKEEIAKNLRELLGVES